MFETFDDRLEGVPNTMLTQQSDICGFAVTAVEIPGGRIPNWYLRNEAMVVVQLSQKKMLQREQYIEITDLQWSFLETLWALQPEKRPDMRSVVAGLKNIHVSTYPRVPGHSSSYVDPGDSPSDSRYPRQAAPPGGVSGQLSSRQSTHAKETYTPSLSLLLQPLPLSSRSFVCHHKACHALWLLDENPSSALLNEVGTHRNPAHRPIIVVERVHVSKFAR
ncbi:hypothetical protein JAAARDRAFT_478385 [Jaapia argillacea MUCL 33604]|uniref:Protein kinase domain-containing protein n=1 Tax=Jaapia argillacea MUCL 33604 TaxID=933084 RepID=A0A067PFB2_9AGAM|nr:hypothetical protein JAAARDRAFT_478385 [Jaapia argillacea MUCL 33604]